VPSVWVCCTWAGGGAGVGGGGGGGGGHVCKYYDSQPFSGSPTISEINKRYTVINALRSPWKVSDILFDFNET
jgi:hypothetical protein